MIKERKATVYQTYDGKEFYDIESATAHARYLVALKIAEDIYYHGIGADAIAEGLVRHELISPRVMQKYE